MAKRNATVAVIGAGDFIGAAIAKRFATEGFVIFAGRRNADKLAPLVAAIAQPGDYVVCRGAGSITQWAYALPAELAAAR